MTAMSTSQKPTRMKEGKAAFYAYPAKVVSKDLPVFYNPAMKVNRDLTILLLTAIEDSRIRACDALAGTGVRTVRMLMELPTDKLQTLVSNDANPKFPLMLRKNLGQNKLQTKLQTKITAQCLIVKNQDACRMLLESKGFDYIDIDPFGTPNPFLDAAIKRLSRTGILAVTATDTSALCGSFPKACIRKYWAMPRHDHLMHEAGLRILIRKIQLVGAQYEKALAPIYSYSHEHHMRVFLRAAKQKTAVDSMLAKHALWDQSGPLWTGRLWDPALAKKIDLGVESLVHLGIPPLSNAGNSLSQSTKAMTSLISGESAIDAIGFVDIHALGKLLHIGNLPKTEELIESINAQGYAASRTHFSGTGVRTSMPVNEVIHIIKNYSYV